MKSFIHYLHKGLNNKTFDDGILTSASFYALQTY